MKAGVPQFRQQSQFSSAELHELWKNLLYDTLRDSPRPLFIFNDATVPAASIWTGARLWVDSFRSADLRPGDSIVLSLPPSPAFIQTLVAAFWTQTSLIITDPDPDINFEYFRSTFSARGSIHSEETGPGWTATKLSGPESSRPLLPPSQNQTNEDIRVYIQSSGTTGPASWYGLSDRNILSVLQSHTARLNPAKKAISYLPWSHSFGLVLGLLNHLVSNRIVIRDPNSGRDINSLIDLCESQQPSYINTVPSLVEKLQSENHSDLLNLFDEGIVGGAPIRKSHATVLENTNLRVGYGQTEASPGVMLGEPGQWEADILGKPVGCSTRIRNGELEFKGLNAHEVSLDESELQRHSCPRWVPTGDKVRRSHNTYYFDGRQDYTINLSNGRQIHTPSLERSIRNTLSSLESIFLFNDDENHLQIFVDGECQFDDLKSQISHELGSLTKYVKGYREMDENSVKYTPKGAVDRNRTRTHLLKSNSSM